MRGEPGVPTTELLKQESTGAHVHKCVHAHTHTHRHMHAQLRTSGRGEAHLRLRLRLLLLLLRLSMVYTCAPAAVCACMPTAQSHKTLARSFSQEEMLLKKQEEEGERDTYILHRARMHVGKPVPAMNACQGTNCFLIFLPQ